MTAHGDLEREARVFISYSRTDEQAVVKLAADLEAGGDIKVLRDKEDILPAEDWRERLGGLVLGADALVFCLSSAALRSEEVRREVESAEHLSKRIVPVVLQPFQERVPPSIASLNYIFLTDPASWDEGVAKLRSAVRTDIAWIREHTRLGELAQRWDAGGRRRDDLLRGAALDAAEVWLARQPRHAPDPTPLQREFVREGRNAATRRQRQWVTGSLVVATIAVGLSILAYWQREIAVAQRTEATARRLSAEAQLILANPLANSATAVRNLLVSLSLAPSSTASEALAAGVRRLEPRPLGDLAWPSDAGELRRLAFSQDGAWLGAITSNEALFWDVRSRKLVGRYSLPRIDARPTLSFVPGGMRALVELRAAPTPDGAAAEWATPSIAAAWTVIDLANAHAQTLTSAEALDVRIAGSTILALEKTGTAPPVIVDIVSGANIPAPQLAEDFGLVVFGRIFALQQEQLIKLMPIPVPPHQPLPDIPAVLLVGDKGSGIMSPVGSASGSQFRLPPGSEPIAFALGGVGPVLAIHREGSSDAVISPSIGRPLWEAPGPDVRFLGFAASGRLMRVRDADGVRFESLGGGMLRAESSRRTDYDLSTINDLTRYTPIVSVEVAEQSGEIATAWKDGRITLWEATRAPRYGGVGGIPMPSFQALARFDHGEELGAKVGWVDPPSLFVAPTGRYIASESLGIQTNPVGGVTAFDPLIRIWDSHHGGEIARFRPGGMMEAAFAPTDDILATATIVLPGSDAKRAGATSTLKLELWNLREGDEAVQTTRQSLAIAVTAPAIGAANQSGSAAAKPVRSTMPVHRFPAPIWVSVDLKVRALGANSDSIGVIDDLEPTLHESLAAATRDRDRPPSSEGTEQPGQVSLEDRLRSFVAAAYPEPPPPEAPLPFPLSVSGDGRRAILAFGTTLRLYALDEQPRLLRSFDLPPLTNTTSAISGPVGLTISSDGAYFAVALAVPSTAARPADERGGAAAKIQLSLINVKLLVFKADTASPLQEISQTMFMLPPQLLRLHERLVALGPAARIGVIDETTIASDASGPPLITARLVVRSLTNGQEILALPSRQLHVQPFGSWEADGASDPVAAFDASGTRLVVMRERPDCPMKADVNPQTWMPSAIPACPERRIDLALWDLDRRQQLAETSFVVRPDRRGDGSPPTGPSAPTMTKNSGVDLTARFSLDLGSPSVVSIGSSEMRIVEGDDQPKLELVVVRRRVSIEQASPAVTAACERLPPDFAQIDRDTWNELVPNETYRSICLSG